MKEQEFENVCIYEAFEKNWAKNLIFKTHHDTNGEFKLQAILGIRDAKIGTQKGDEKQIFNNYELLQNT